MSSLQCLYFFYFRNYSVAVYLLITQLSCNVYFYLVVLFWEFFEFYSILIAVSQTMYFDNDFNVFKNGSDFEDKQFDNLALIIDFPRRRKIFRPRTDYFSWWWNDEFFDRYKLSKNIVRFIIDLIDDC